MHSSLLYEYVSEGAVASGGAREPSWPTLLVVDSDPAMMQALVCFFERRGFHVAAAASLAEARALFHRRKTWTLIIADYHLPDGTGRELCCWVHDRSEATPFLLMSGSPHGAALCAGTDFLLKPFPLEKLSDYVHLVLSRG